MSTDTSKEDELKKECVFKICGMDKELSLELSQDTLISDILQQLSTFCSIKSSALQIRNGNENLNDMDKKLSDYAVEDASNFLVLRDDILEGDNNTKQKTQSNADEEHEIKQMDNEPQQSQPAQPPLVVDEEEEWQHDEEESVHPLPSSDQLPSVKSPTMPSVPNNSFATESPQIKKSTQGLYSALEALSSSKNAQKLHSLAASKKN
eukprot:CAMPEP_0197038000 /NCGR_PEP_ID=MMETSP1384-20130603/15062_1 /TAXON_ID=29189 /ORGANISM="Ammonia sp." /LENGTH=206 /DNA_ID=CAMNT_0042468387 /DNA_START=137 /DNA_END=757 /DNA_ORIENTATION=-